MALIIWLKTTDDDLWLNHNAMCVVCNNICKQAIDISGS